jgi:acylphosphatase
MTGTVADHRQAKRFLVSGEVQGVGYRFFAQRVADRLGVAGYVKNLSDGRVEVYAIGTAAQLSSMRAELARGPRAAEVSSVSEEEETVQAKYADGFGIEHDW